MSAMNNTNADADDADSATAIEASVTAVDAQNGFLRMRPAGRSQPNATFMSYDEAFNVSNTEATSLRPSLANTRCSRSPTTCR